MSLYEFHGDNAAGLPKLSMAQREFLRVLWERGWPPRTYNRLTYRKLVTLGLIEYRERDGRTTFTASARAQIQAAVDRAHGVAA